MYVPNAEIAVEQKQTWQVLSGLRRAPKRAVPKSWWLGIGLLTLSVLVLYVHTVGREASLLTMQNEIKNLERENTDLRWSLASLQNPENVETKAENVLGMQEPKDVVFMQKPDKLVPPPQVNQIPPPPAVIHEGF